jgi:NADH:ubiquinone oxidoreductase subunit F (NADH-binding)
MLTDSEREDRRAYLARGGYRPGLTGSELVAAVAASGLRGRGGGAFPLGRKLAAVAGLPGEHVLVVNAEEGEPLSVKDRWLCRTRPHLVIDGAVRAASAIGATSAYVYVSDDEAIHSLRAALAELADLPVATSVWTVPAAYVAGEETAAIRAINGGPAMPSDKPPRPFEEGVRGLPTLVSNVETIANLPGIATGDDRRPDTFLMTLSGDCPRPGLFEVPFGVPLGEVIAGGRPRGYLMGGYSAGLLNGRGHDLVLDYDGLVAEGTALGCGAVTVLGPTACPVGVTSQVLAYFDGNNAGQCGSCFHGTAAMSGVASALAHGAAGWVDVQRLHTWSTTLPGRGACGTLDGAAMVALTLLREFPGDVEAHVRKRCASCARMDLTARIAPFAVASDAVAVAEA